MVRARGADKSCAIEAALGANLRQALEGTPLRVRTGCNSNGSCGLCRIRILSGPVSPPTEEERLNLGPSLVEDGVRLACQTLPLDDVELEVVNLAPSSAWRTIPSESLGGLVTSRPSRSPESGSPAQISRIALDIGTTNICLGLWGEADSRRLAARRGPNPQSNFGADVVTRLQAAHDPAVAQYLAGAVESAVAEVLRWVAKSEGLTFSAYPTILAVETRRCFICSRHRTVDCWSLRRGLVRRLGHRKGGFAGNSVLAVR
jgi:ferredoxin